MKLYKKQSKTKNKSDILVDSIIKKLLFIMSLTPRSNTFSYHDVSATVFFIQNQIKKNCGIL